LISPSNFSLTLSFFLSLSLSFSLFLSFPSSFFYRRKPRVWEERKLLRVFIIFFFNSFTIISSLSSPSTYHHSTMFINIYTFLLFSFFSFHHSLHHISHLLHHHLHHHEGENGTSDISRPEWMLMIEMWKEFEEIEVDGCWGEDE
jgi:hypothetical protein